MNAHAKEVRRARVLAVAVAVITAVLLYNLSLAAQLDLQDALFLTKNSIKELGSRYFPRRDGQDAGAAGADLDFPLNNMVNSIFPIDAEIAFNTSDGEPVRLTGRYASFSPLVGGAVRGRWAVVPVDACSAVDVSSEYQDKILVSLRGNCTFVSKVTNLLGSRLRPKAIVIANDEPNRGLITMYSSTFNQDGTLTTPIVFVTWESYVVLRAHAGDAEATLRTASLGSWLNIMVSMILSPPLLVVVFYVVIKLGQSCRRIHDNKRSEKIVRKLPVYIYCSSHLVPTSNFFRYLRLTGQAAAAADSSSASSTSGTSAHSDVVPDGAELERYGLDLLLVDRDFYPSFKCSICLDKFRPLRSRVLVLQCKHFFHEDCLSNWLINFKRRCPLCNHAIGPLEPSGPEAQDAEAAEAEFESQGLLAGETPAYDAVGESYASNFTNYDNDATRYDTASATRYDAYDASASHVSHVTSYVTAGAESFESGTSDSSRAA